MWFFARMGWTSWICLPEGECGVCFPAPRRSWMLLLRNARHSHLWPTRRWTKKEAGYLTSAAKLMRWGVFPAKEIVQPTVVDPSSFIVWKDEPFEIWSRGWAQLYPEGDPSRKLLEEVQCSAVLSLLLCFYCIPCWYARQNDLWLVFEVFPSSLLSHEFWKESDVVGIVHYLSRCRSAASWSTWSILITSTVIYLLCSKNSEMMMRGFLPFDGRLSLASMPTHQSDWNQDRLWLEGDYHSFYPLKETTIHSCDLFFFFPLDWLSSIYGYVIAQSLGIWVPTDSFLLAEMKEKNGVEQ